MENKIALITGSAKRIGKEIATQLHEGGYDIAIHYNESESDASNLAGSLNNIRKDSCMTFKACLAKSPESLVQDVISWRGRLDVLINNASLFIKDIDSLDRWEELFNCNVKAPYILSCDAKPHLEKTNGSIINLTDIHALEPIKDYTIYCMTKAALISQTKALAKEFAPNIRVNAISPGAIAWPEGKNKLSDDVKEKIIENTPLHRHGEPKDIANACKFLIENDFITGQIINVDGGRSL